MNQLCRVCAEPAAGFHFGAFTCEGCKSFFGRTCNNVSSLGDCKNGGSCVITRKNRTACKSCRLRKCLGVGMSKSGSRYGRRSNWFKIHCLLQDQQASSEAVNEKAKSILEDMQLSSLKSEAAENNNDGEETTEVMVGPSSPTVTSTDSNDPHFPAEVPIGLNLFNWLNRTNGIPPEAIPLFAALSPFLMTSGISSQSQINAANFSQYYPYLISLMSGGVTSALDQPTISISPFSVPSSRTRDESSERGSTSPKIKEYKAEIMKFNSSLLHQQQQLCSSKSSEESFINHQNTNNIDSQTNHSNVSKFGTDTKLDSFSHTYELPTPKLKAVFVDRMRREDALTVDDSAMSRKRKISPNETSSASDDEFNLEQNILKRLQTKSVHDLQSEPIDLSLKSLPVKPIPIPIPTSCASVLACSMTLTPISSYDHSSSISEDAASNLDTASDLVDERSASAIDLSCRG